MIMWCLCADPLQGIWDVGVSLAEHKRRFLTPTVAVCRSYNEVNGTHGLNTHRRNQTKPCGSWRYIQCFPHIDFTCASRPGIFGDPFLFLLLLSSYTFFFFIRLRKWNNLRLINYWTIPPPLYTFGAAGSVCSRTVHTPTDDLQCFSCVHLFVPSRFNISRPLPSSLAWL